MSQTTVSFREPYSMTSLCPWTLTANKDKLVKEQQPCRHIM